MVSNYGMQRLAHAAATEEKKRRQSRGELRAIAASNAACGCILRSRGATRTRLGGSSTQQDLASLREMFPQLPAPTLRRALLR